MKKMLPCLATLLLAGSAHGQVFQFSTPLAPEGDGSTGSGSALVAYDLGNQTLQIDFSFLGLTGTTTVAHIHAPTALPFTGIAGVAVTPGTLPGFPAGVTSATYSQSIDLTDTGSYTAGFLTLGGGTVAGASALLLDSFNDGTAYLNIHTSFANGGEIRGFLTAVPEPMTTSVAMAGLLAAGAWARHRSRKN